MSDIMVFMCTDENVQRIFWMYATYAKTARSQV